MKSSTYSEVYQVMQYLPEGEYKLIPKWQIDFIKNNMDTNAKRICTINTKIEDIELSLEAKTLLLSLFYMNIATPEQKSKIDRILLAEDQKQNEKMRENMFRNDTKINGGSKKDVLEENKNVSLMIIKEDSIFIKLKKFLKKLFKRK